MGPPARTDPTQIRPNPNQSPAAEINNSQQEENLKMGHRGKMKNTGKTGGN